ncbi:MAG: hypothetical protein J7L76_08960, partial [Spirochaetaceae bacterium]|nr:hypothetical protein [Spirochaetaceae bacterium]
MEAFKPVSHAFSDTMLQVRAKPLVFLLIWLTLSMAPQLLLSYAFQQPVSDMMDTSFQLMNDAVSTGTESPELTPETSETILKGVRAVSVMIIVLLVSEIYLGSVLAGVVRQFRNRILPVYTDSLKEGLGRFKDFARAIFVSGFKILIKPLVVF